MAHLRLLSHFNCRRFCVLLHKKWFGTNSEHFYLPQNGSEQNYQVLSVFFIYEMVRERNSKHLSLLLLHTSEVVFALIFPLFILL
jgi:hypothetical protein